MNTNIKIQSVPAYVGSLRIAAKVLEGCVVHIEPKDSRAAARFSIQEARKYLEEAEAFLDVSVIEEFRREQGG